jgi:hypothetical protein
LKTMKTKSILSILKSGPEMVIAQFCYVVSLVLKAQNKSILKLFKLRRWWIRKRGCPNKIRREYI